MFDPSPSQLPIVNGRPTTLHRLTYEELKQHTYHRTSHQATRNGERVQEATQLIEEMDESAITYILTSESTIVVSLSDQKYDPQKSHDPEDPFVGVMYQNLETVGQSSRTIRTLVTDPSLMGQGIASWFLQYSELQITELHGDVQLMPQTIYEINGRYYEKRGWKTGARFWNSPEGYTIVRMEKVIRLVERS
ncbi:hypothetical protein EXIGLDRAFT_778673 [Exidia glandulosa HHB12029]|uniref:N-acetyltransferase domain-containing protein n=1 Tax=Exidia glandulosa HHB12029 TaxID=1314781 RepID=A0A165CF45_EXIGL|nr:hypothetical protein EXIGLDRAFT_778673 [Exidia glandulosa HHB12029]